ncbi:unnamed protein product [Ectocarpus sp. 12 AP-2014]
MATEELRLADHFPLVHKSCKKPAARFFECFSEKADQPPEGDAAAARKGLAACASLMADYDKCMSKVPARPLIRVQEEYRLAPGAKR